jgi:hypothetical protein
MAEISHKFSAHRTCDIRKGDDLVSRALWPQDGWNMTAMDDADQIALLDGIERCQGISKVAAVCSEQSTVDKAVNRVRSIRR